MSEQLPLLPEPPRTFRGDPCAKYHRGNEASRAAFQSHRPEDLAGLRLLVQLHLRAQGERGATCEEIEQALGLRHQTASARVTELIALNAINRRGDKRRTQSGRAAFVLRAVQ